MVLEHDVIGWQTTINTDQLQQGVYIYVLEDKTKGKQAVGKWIKQ